MVPVSKRKKLRWHIFISGSKVLPFIGLFPLWNFTNHKTNHLIPLCLNRIYILYQLFLTLKRTVYDVYMHMSLHSFNHRRLSNHRNQLLQCGSIKILQPPRLWGLKYSHHSSLFLCIACLPTAIWLVSLSDTIYYCYCSPLAEAALDGFPVLHTDSPNASVGGWPASLIESKGLLNIPVLFLTCSLLTTVIDQIDESFNTR